jgi:HSP20 family protein
MFRSLQREIDHLFDDFSRGVPSFGDGSERFMTMKLDMAETDKSFEVTADLPGSSPENIDISLKDHQGRNQDGEGGQEQELPSPRTLLWHAPSLDHAASWGRCGEYRCAL